ncbi:MAG: type II toxin-antitoxin system VapC family toxin [Planctomycetota bacterium]|nr:type II toxin-antitoxin system VapC family toxin [Planctomycetaceae bacterium]MDQ3332519.1 type II toxin-antitoxin system VapC family toxin [Planctomycetota bacterium]
MKPVFLDSGDMLALESASDQHHTAAVAHWDRFVMKKGPRLVTTTFVLAEIVAFMNRRGWHGKAVRVGHRFLESPSIELLHVDESLFRSGWDFFCRHADKRYSLTDCISFVLMRDRGIRQALAFDRHFEQAGLERLPGEGRVP